MSYEFDYVKYAIFQAGRDRLQSERLRALVEDRKSTAFSMGSSDDSDDTQEAAWNGRVARDLGLAFHKAGIEKHEESYEMKLRAEDGDTSNPERMRMQGS